MIIVNPNHRNPSPQAAIEPPVWCAYIAAYNHGHTGKVEILDAEAEGLSLEQTIKRIGEQPAIFVAMGANPSASSTPKMDVINKLKETYPISYIVGLHPQAVGDRSLLGFPSPERLCDLKPRWDLVDFTKYRAHNWHCLGQDNRDNYGAIYTSFGCPFDCSYCNIHAIYRTRKVAYRKPQDVISEIDYLVKRGVKNLKICDELFVLNPVHVNEICDLLIERDYKLNIWAYARVDTINLTLLNKMKKAGINWLAYGFEGVSLFGVKYANQVAYETVKITHQAGINVMGNFMFGLPDDTLESMAATFKMAQSLKCDWVNFYCTMAYPGSKLYEDTKSEDLPEKWVDYDQYSPNTKPLPTKYLSPKEILTFRDNAFVKYFTDTDYLKRIKGKFSNKATEQIQEMLEWKIR